MNLDIDLPPYRPVGPAAESADHAATLPRRQRYRYFRPLLVGRRVLEIGCGDGGGADFLAQKAAEVVGVDPSPTLVDHAHEHHRRPNLNFSQGEGVPQGTRGAVDAVVCFQSSWASDEAGTFLASCRDALTRDGLVILAAPNADSPESVRARLAPYFPEVELFRQPPFAPWDPLPGWSAQDRAVLAVGSARPVRRVRESYLNPTGIVILCHNNLRYSNLCLRSLAQFTPEPIDIVLVDNGSSDRTPEWTASLRKAFANVRVITNRENRGYAPAANQGLAELPGRNVVLLNNDAVVTPGWLARMLMVLREDERCGLVGPVCNQAAAPQKVDGLGYGDDMDRMLAEAVRLAIDAAGVGFDTNRLSDFCLLIRREVIDKIGGFDERFRPGFYEDDDYGVRASLAGFRLKVAADVFVHHFGSVTFRSILPDPGPAALENWTRFTRKWGIEESSDPRSPVLPKILPRGFEQDRDYIALPCSVSA